MFQTLEATVDATGEIRLLTEISLEKNRRALVMVFDEERKKAETSKKENPN